jgi:hypothetical protein
MTEQIPATLIAGDRAVEIRVSPAQLYEHYRLMILVGEGSNAPKIRRAMEYVAEARAAGAFTAAQADKLDRLAEKALWTTEHPEEAERDDDGW